MKRMPRGGRRVWAYLGSNGPSCVIWGQPRPFGRWAPWAVETSVSAYSSRCYRKTYGGRLLRTGESAEDVERGREVAGLITGEVVYAFYSRESHAIKIGRTADLLGRWSKLECQAGQLRQLLSVWRCPGGDARDYEHELHRRWIEHRTFGEWFTADPVLADLRQMWVDHRIVQREKEEAAERLIAAVDEDEDEDEVVDLSGVDPLDLDQLAAVLGAISREQLSKMHARGTGPRSVMNGDRPMFWRADVRRWITELQEADEAGRRERRERRDAARILAEAEGASSTAQRG